MNNPQPPDDAPAPQPAQPGQRPPLPPARPDPAEPVGDEALRNDSAEGSTIDGELTEAAQAALDGITPIQERAVTALLVEPSVAAAARTAGVGLRTLHNWMRDAKFVAAYRRLRREAFGQAIGLTQRLAPVAVGTLAKIMTDTGAPPTARVAAAATLLRFGRDALELDDLAERLEVLEATPGAEPDASAARRKV